MRKFVDLLGDSLYKAPSRALIGGDLLEQEYLKLQAKILAILKEQDHIQFVLDESSDINHCRTVNISVVVPSYSSFFLENEHVGDAALTAAFFVDWFFKKTKIYISDWWLKVLVGF